MRFNRKSLQQPNSEEECHCPPSHNSSIHDAKGCHGEIVRFRCVTAGHQQSDHGATECLVTLPCQCKFKGVKAQKSGTIVLQSEKQ